MTAISEVVLPSLLPVAGKENCRNLIFHKGKCMLVWRYSHHKDWSWRNKGPQAESLGLAEVFHSLVFTVMQVVQPSQVVFLLCMLVTVSYLSLCKDKVSWLQPLLLSKIAFHIQGELMSQNFAGSMFHPSWVLPAAVVTNLAAQNLQWIMSPLLWTCLLSFVFPLGVLISAIYNVENTKRLGLKRQVDALKINS